MCVRTKYEGFLVPSLSYLSQLFFIFSQQNNNNTHNNHESHHHTVKKTFLSHNSKNSKRETQILMIGAEPLTAKAYAPFGQVRHQSITHIHVSIDISSCTTRAGGGVFIQRKHRRIRVAPRRNWLGKLMNLRGGEGKPNMYVDSIHIIIENMRKQINKIYRCVFRCSPRSMPFDVKLLERHEYSTQCFIPMNATRYLVVVADGGMLYKDSKRACTYTHSISHTNRQGSTEHVNASRVSSTRESGNYVQSRCVASSDDRPGQSHGLCLFGMGRWHCKRL